MIQMNAQRPQGVRFASSQRAECTRQRARIGAVLIAAFLLLSSFSSLAGTLSQTRYPGAAVGDWSNAETLLGAAGSGCATTTASNAYLFLTEYGFDIPSEASVLGVEVAFTAGHSAGGRFGLYLLSDGETTGRWKTVGLNQHVTSCGDTWYRDYGGDDDLWSYAWTVQQINDTGFGLRIASGTTAGTRFVSSAPITIYYEVACLAPSIVDHPSSVIATANESVSFNVLASGTEPLSYQWERNTAGSWQTIAGAVQSTLVIGSASKADEGVYRVVVTNGCDQAVSEHASLDVILLSPVVTWNTPQEIIYGTPLGGEQLNATADVAGSFVYSPGSGTVLPAGTNTLSLEFAPADPDRYQNGTANVSITVQKADAEIDVTGYSGIYDGESHGATGTATGVEGEDLSGDLDLGTGFINVPGGTARWTFTDSTGNYNNAAGSVEIVITGARLVVTAEDQSKRFDAEPFVGFTVSYRGFVDGDGPDALRGLLTFRGSAVDAVDPGSYRILPSGLRSDNYAIHFEPGALTISPYYQANLVEGMGGYTDQAVEGGGGAVGEITVKSVYEIGQTIRVSFTVTGFYGEEIMNAPANVCLIGGESTPAPIWFAAPAVYDVEAAYYVVEIPTAEFWGVVPQPGAYIVDITLGDGSHMQETIQLVESPSAAE